jgi:hypothetical protein
MEAHGSIIVSQMIAGMMIITMVCRLMIENDGKPIGRETLRLIGLIMKRQPDASEEHDGDVTSNIDVEADTSVMSDDDTNLVLKISVVTGDTVVSNKEMEIRNIFGNPSPGPCEGSHTSVLLSVSEDEIKSTDAGIRFMLVPSLLPMAPFCLRNVGVPQQALVADAGVNKRRTSRRYLGPMGSRPCRMILTVMALAANAGSSRLRRLETKVSPQYRMTRSHLAVMMLK